MSHGQRAAWLRNRWREFGGRRLAGMGWMNRGPWTKWLTHRRERREAAAEIRRQLKEERS